MPYEVKQISLENNEQKEQWFLDINPNGRIPAMGERASPSDEDVASLKEACHLIISAGLRTGGSAPDKALPVAPYHAYGMLRTSSFLQKPADGVTGHSCVRCSRP